MIKILNEEPIVYQGDAENTQNWVYKNPTKKEIEEFPNKDSYRFLTNGSDLYIASGYNFVHYSMAISLKPYTGLPYTTYDCYYVETKRGKQVLTAGDRCVTDYVATVTLERLKPFIPNLLYLGIINKDTIVKTFWHSDEQLGTVSEFYNI